MLTLYTTPVIYLAFDRLARRLARRTVAESPSSAVVVAPHVLGGSEGA
jgi:hypothetical protein